MTPAAETFACLCEAENWYMCLSTKLLNHWLCNVQWIMINDRAEGSKANYTDYSVGIIIHS